MFIEIISHRARSIWRRVLADSSLPTMLPINTTAISTNAAAQAIYWSWLLGDSALVKMVIGSVAIA